MASPEPANAVERVDAILASAFEDDQARRAALCAARANEFKGLSRTRDFERGRYRISILDTRVSGPQVEIFARVFRDDGEQVGFGHDGSVDVERFVIVNPPMTVRDPAGSIIRLGKSRLAIERETRFRIDLQACLEQVLEDMIVMAGKIGMKIRKGKEGRTTYTIFSNGNDDGYIDSNNATYLTARSGSGFGVQTGGGGFEEGSIGQTTGFTCWETFVNFTTSSVVGTVSSAVLSLYGSFDSSTTDFTINARRHDYTAGGLTTGDWTAGASLSARALLASRSTSGWTNAGYNVFTSDANFLTNINQSGVTGIVLSSARHEAGTTPSGDENVGPFIGSRTGTTNDPRLVIEAGAGSFPPFNPNRFFQPMLVR